MNEEDKREVELMLKEFKANLELESYKRRTETMRVYLDRLVWVLPSFFLGLFFGMVLFSAWGHH